MHPLPPITPQHVNDAADLRAFIAQMQSLANAAVILAATLTGAGFLLAQTARAAGWL